MSAIEVKVPAIGDYKDVPVIEVHVSAGDAVRRDDPLITLESDKAAMEVPSPEDGEIAEVLVKVGDKLSEGSPIVRLAAERGQETTERKAGPTEERVEPEEPSEERSGAQPSEAPPQDVPEALQNVPWTAETSPLPSAGDDDGSARVPLPLGSDFGGVHASPSVRRLARELDIDLRTLNGSGAKGRITKDDVKRALGASRGAGAGAGLASGIPEIAPQDFSKYGPIETQPLSRLKRLGGPQLHRAWLNIPHVTHADEADITDLEAYRKSLDDAAKEKGYRVTLLAFIMKACVVVLKEFPIFNASLAPDKETLILKRFYHLGIAVDTADGLVVPVIRDVDRKGIVELSQDIGNVSARMRDGKIAPADIQGGTFSISSIGGIGGTCFTPIINAPEVAILGVLRAKMAPKWNGEQFVPRLMLPLVLSYDHRVIDGAEAARFSRRLAVILKDVRQLVL